MNETNLKSAVLTLAELREIAIFQVERAVASKNLSLLEGPANLLQQLGTITSSYVIIEGQTSQDVAYTHQWLKQAFPVYVDTPVLSILYSNQPGSDVLNTSAIHTLRQCGIPLDHEYKRVQIPSTRDTADSCIVSYQLRYFSRPLMQIMQSIRDKMREFALEHAQQTGMGRMPEKHQLTQYCKWIRDNNTKNRFTAESTPPTAVTPVPRLVQVIAQTAQPQTQPLPLPTPPQEILSVHPMRQMDEVITALGKRLELLERRIKFQTNSDPKARTQILHSEWSKAKEECDPLDIAAVACLMWDIGLKPHLSSPK